MAEFPINLPVVRGEPQLVCGVVRSTVETSTLSVSWVMEEEAFVAFLEDKQAP